MLGKRAVYSKFFTHKISKEVLDPVIKQLYNIYPLDETILAILTKRKYHENLHVKARHKIIRHLKRKGFLWDEINQVLQNKIFHL